MSSLPQAKGSPSPVNSSSSINSLDTTFECASGCVLFLVALLEGETCLSKMSKFPCYLLLSFSSGPEAPGDPKGTEYCRNNTDCIGHMIRG